MNCPSVSCPVASSPMVVCPMASWLWWIDRDELSHSVPEEGLSQDLNFGTKLLMFRSTSVVENSRGDLGSCGGQELLFKLPYFPLACIYHKANSCLPIVGSVGQWSSLVNGEPTAPGQMGKTSMDECKEKEEGNSQDSCWEASLPIQVLKLNQCSKIKTKMKSHLGREQRLLHGGREKGVQVSLASSQNLSWIVSSRILIVNHPCYKNLAKLTTFPWKWSEKASGILPVLGYKDQIACKTLQRSTLACPQDVSFSNSSCIKQSIFHSVLGLQLVHFPASFLFLSIPRVKETNLPNAWWLCKVEILESLLQMQPFNRVIFIS